MRPSERACQKQTDAAWAMMIPEAEWSRYRRVLEAALAEGLPFALGGGLAFSHYACRWRDTKDIDLYILPRHRDRFVAILEKAGFRDLHAEKPYDRRWIHRGVFGGIITDLIWAMANQRAQVDEAWFEHAPVIGLRGLEIQLLPVEELIWSKLYVVQRDRCDWPDLLNILNVQGPGLNWDRLFLRLEDDARLLGALLSLFGWLCPVQAGQMPAWVWERLQIQPARESGQGAVSRDRVALLDSRDWFGRKNPCGGL